MGLRTSVIVNGINNLSDARYCAGMGVDVISFNLKLDDPERVQPQTLKEISGWVSGVKLAGEFERAKPEIINELADEFNLDLIQLDIPYLIDEIEEINRPVIQKVFINKDTVVSELLEMMDLYSPYVHSFLIYSNDFVTIDGTNEKLLKEVAKKHEVYIGFGLEKDNVQNIVENVKPTGIGLQGGDEIRPGYKNFDEFQDIFDELED
jgi:phosphoribosylanthranilate isomerase